MAANAVAIPMQFQTTLAMREVATGPDPSFVLPTPSHFALPLNASKTRGILSDLRRSVTYLRRLWPPSGADICVQGGAAHFEFHGFVQRKLTLQAG